MVNGRPHRAKKRTLLGPTGREIKVIGGVGLGSTASVYDVSIASPYHTTRVQSLPSTLHTCHKDRVVRYSSVFTNFYPIVMTHTGIRHPSVNAIFDSLSACGVDVVALKRSIAFGLLRSRAQAYRAIYDAVKTPRSDVDYSLSPLLCACRLCSYSGHHWSRYTCTSHCGSANGHRLMVYRVLTYARFAFAIKYIISVASVGFGTFIYIYINITSVEY